MRTSSPRDFWLGPTTLLLALLVQFAPSFHELVSHDRDTGSCHHGLARIHFEACDLDRNDEAACPLCMSLLHRSFWFVVPTVQRESGAARLTRIPDFLTPPVFLAFQHPDGRGPPLPL